MKTDSMKETDTYNVVNCNGKILWKNVSLDTIRIVFTKYDYPLEEY